MTRKEVNTTASEATAPGEAGGERMVDLVGKLLALQPLGVETVDTKLGENVATYCYVLEIVDDPDGDAIDHFEQPVFWQVVRAQLDERTSDEVPWVVARLEKMTKAYVLRAVTPEEHERATRQIKSWSLTMAEAETDAAAAGEEPF